MAVEADVRRRLRPTTLAALPIATLTVLSAVGTTLAPVLVGNHPLLLVALSPRLPFLALAAPRVSVLAFVVVGVARLCAATPSYLKLGQWAGQRTPDDVGGRLHRVLSRLQGRARFAGLFCVALRPSGAVAAAVVAAGVPSSAVWATDMASKTARLVLVYGITRGTVG